MKVAFAIILLLFGFVAFPQNSNKDLNEVHQQLNKPRNLPDSSTAKPDSLQLNQLSNSIINTYQSEQNNSSLDHFVSDQREQERKTRQRLWMRIGFGVILAVVGIIGISRRPKAKK